MNMYIFNFLRLCAILFDKIICEELFQTVTYVRAKLKNQSEVNVYNTHAHCAIYILKQVVFMQEKFHQIQSTKKANFLPLFRAYASHFLLRTGGYFAKESTRNKKRPLFNFSIFFI